MSTDIPTDVSLDRVVQVMESFGIQLRTDGGDDAGAFATANLNGYQVVFAALDSVLIVRADVPTEQSVDDGDPTWHLACNQANCFNVAAKAVAVDRTEKIIIRTEKPVLIAAGSSEEQLRAMVKNAVDHVLAMQEAVASAESTFRGRGSQ